jgi:hypothetical protein
LDSPTHFSVIPFSPGRRCNKKVSIQGISDKSLEWCFTQPLICSLGDLHFCHSFLLVPKTPSWQETSFPNLRLKYYSPLENISVCT